MALLIIRLKSKKIAVSEYDFEEVPEQHFQVEKNQLLSRFLVHISLQRIQPIRNCNPKKSTSIKIPGAHFIIKNSTN